MTKATKLYFGMIVCNIIAYLVVAGKLDTHLTATEMYGLKWGIVFNTFSLGCALLGIVAEYIFSDLIKENKGE